MELDKFYHEHNFSGPHSATPSPSINNKASTSKSPWRPQPQSSYSSTSSRRHSQYNADPLSNLYPLAPASSAPHTYQTPQPPRYQTPASASTGSRVNTPNQNLTSPGPESPSPSPVLTPQHADSQATVPKQFQCPQCPLSFRRNHDLKRHVKIHLPVRPYTCELCNKAFNRKDALRRHVISKACKMGPSKQSSQQPQQFNSRAPISTYEQPLYSEPSSSSPAIQNAPYPSVTSPNQTSAFQTSQHLSEEFESLFMDPAFDHFPGVDTAGTSNLDPAVTASGPDWTMYESTMTDAPSASQDQGQWESEESGKATGGGEANASHQQYWGSPWIWMKTLNVSRRRQKRIFITKWYFHLD